MNADPTLKQRHVNGSCILVMHSSDVIKLPTHLMSVIGTFFNDLILVTILITV